MMNKIIDLLRLNVKTFKADTMEELEQIWQNDLMTNGWDVVHIVDVHYSFFGKPYYYFKAKKSQ